MTGQPRWIAQVQRTAESAGGALQRLACGALSVLSAGCWQCRGRRGLLHTLTQQAMRVAEERTCQESVVRGVGGFEGLEAERGHQPVAPGRSDV